LKILDRWDSLAKVGTSGWPASLTNHEGLVVGVELGDFNGFLESFETVLNVSTLPVWESIHNDNL
jgi:hypothetical protein